MTASMCHLMHAKGYALYTIRFYQERYSSIRKLLDLSCEQINAKILFFSFSRKFHALKIFAYTVNHDLKTYFNKF